jgi:lysophospholipase L1-like esterase
MVRRTLIALLGFALLAPCAAPQAASKKSGAPVKKLPAAKGAPRGKRGASKHTTSAKRARSRVSAAKTVTARASRGAGSRVASGTQVVPHGATQSAHAVASWKTPSPRQKVNREELVQQISEELANPPIGIENAAALRPFFDQLHQLEADPKGQLVRVLQFGDSHTAADMFTGALRTLFQSKWGDGGPGFSFAGYPFAGYRIHGTKRAQSIDWTVEGTHFKDLGEDALVGMGGVSLTTDHAGSWVSLDSDAASLEVQYLIQPGGGRIEVYDGDDLLTMVSTDGPTEAGHFDVPVEPGQHHFEVRTIEDAPVRLLGLTTENAAGVTYEAIGLNGAEASLILRWDEVLQQAYMAQVNPALIVLAYGTNEAGDHTWSEEGYAAMFKSLIARCHRLAPKAAILVIGPPDRALRAGRKGWTPFAGVDRIVQAQRTTCKEMGCAYWDQRTRMGGLGSMRQWVSVQWAQADHTHFTGEGYTELASALFMDIVQQYNKYQGVSTVAEGGRK